MLASVRRGEQPEPRVDDERFMRSLLAAGMWLRPLSAHASMQAFDGPIRGSLARLAATATIYSHVGSHFEDVASAILAWLAWSKCPSLPLADAYARLSFVGQSKECPSPEEFCARMSVNKKPVRVEPRGLLGQLVGAGGESALARLGVKWSPHRSVRFVPKEYRQYWETLPRLLEDLFDALLEPSSPLLSAAYNKIKHGPRTIG